MQPRRLAVSFVLTLAAIEPAFACRLYAPIVIEDVRYADVVLVGRIANYQIVRDEAFRQKMLSNPNLPSDLRKTYEGSQALLSDYARFDVKVDEVLRGSAPDRLSVTWDNSIFGEPERLAGGSFLIALRQPSLPTPPLRGPGATILPTPEPTLYTLLQAPCSSAFLFEDASDEASAIRRVITAN